MSDMKKVKLTVGEVFDTVLGGVAVHSIDKTDSLLPVDKGGYSVVEWASGEAFYPSTITTNDWLIEVDWRETLSHENPVWCWVWDDVDSPIEKSFICKIVSFDCNVVFAYSDTADTGWKLAKPATQEEVMAELFGITPSEPEGVKP